MKRELTLLIDGVQVSVTAERVDNRIVVERAGERHEIVVTSDRIVPSEEAAPAAGSSGTGSGAPARGAQSMVGAQPGKRVASSGRDPGASAGAAPASPAAASSAPGSGEVRAPMVGVVREIHASTGSAVRGGDRVITMEAMKMDIYVNAPVDGTVAAVHCAVGETTTEGAVLATITPDASDGAPAP